MTAVMFDFFGTLVDYSPSRTEQGYPRAAEVLRRAGCDLGYDDWLGLWSMISEEMDRRAEVTGVEFSMFDAFAAFAAPAGLDARREGVAEEFIAAYLAEWSSAVHIVTGVRTMMARLVRNGHQLVLVTNTHDAGMVHGLLDTMGIADALAAVITSVEVGYRKPRPEIFETALAAVDAAPADAVFVGDSFGPDYLGPTRLGISAFLIVANHVEHGNGLSPERRLASVLEIEAKLDA